MVDFRRSYERVAFYFRGTAREIIPQRVFTRALEQRFGAIVPEDLDPRTIARVNYYNRMQFGAVGDSAVHIADISRGSSRYYFDFMEYAKGFGSDVRVNYLPGDIAYVPESPTVVKSRPIEGDTRNSVLLGLNKFRHFRWVRGDITFAQKRDNVVWRGGLGNQLRHNLITRYNDHAEFDIGHTDDARQSVLPKAHLSIKEQCRNRYIISVEGNDVATNLKWIMSSNSLCMMPRPRFETWFMEGTLVPAEHYVELLPDFSDLDDKLAFYRRHPDKALEIIGNAHDYVRQFQDKPEEDLISLLVLQKYFERSGQRQPESFSATAFS